MLEATRVSLAVYSSAKEKGHARNDSEVMEMLRKFQQVLAHGSGPGRRWFKSTRSDEFFQWLTSTVKKSL